MSYISRSADEARFARIPSAVRAPVGLAVAIALFSGVLAPKTAFATQSAELFRSENYFYGRFEARLRFAPGEGVVGAFFLWKDGSSDTTSWNELDYEKILASCRLTTNIWSGKGTQSSMTNTPAFDVCADYHTYTFEWTPDYIALLIDGTQIRKETGAAVAEYTQNASQGMNIHFNVWAGNKDFGGVLDPATLPSRQYINWVQYSSYANGAFQMKWREDFNGTTIPSGWVAGDWESPFKLSTHNPANVTFVNGFAVLSMTADGATGFTGTPPADPGGGPSGGGGTSGNGAGGASGGGTASAGSGGTASAGAGGTGGGSGGSAGNASSGSGGTSSAGASGSGTSGASGAASVSGSGGAFGTGGASGSGAASAGTPNPNGTAGTSAASAPAAQSGEPSGCACVVAPARRGGPMAALLLLAGVVGLRRRSRRARP